MTTPDRARPGTSQLFDQAAAAFSDYRDGSPGRMSDLVRLVTPALWAVARSCRLDARQAEDVVQTTWVRLVQKADTIADPQAVVAWLVTTTRREAWRVSGQATQAPQPDEGIDELVSSDPGPDVVVTTADENSRLWQHVTNLSPRCQALLRVIAYAARPDYAHISRALGMPVGSIGPTRGRCLAALRKALADDPQWTQLENGNRG
ncbi:RNA polymerase sigma factor [Propionibacteriaceae bacterium Y1923]